jgi:hypothetical protein
MINTLVARIEQSEYFAEATNIQRWCWDGRAAAEESALVTHSSTPAPASNSNPWRRENPLEYPVPSERFFFGPPTGSWWTAGGSVGAGARDILRGFSPRAMAVPSRAPLASHHLGGTVV